MESEGKVTVLGFPCNQFGRQEPGTNAQILEFARSRYDANFQMFEKIEVNGTDACDLYRFVKERGAGGGADIAWNYTKFLVSGDGDVLARYEPQVTPKQVAEDLSARGL